MPFLPTPIFSDGFVGDENRSNMFGPLRDSRKNGDAMSFAGSNRRMVDVSPSPAGKRAEFVVGNGDFLLASGGVNDIAPRFYECRFLAESLVDS